MNSEIRKRIGHGLFNIAVWTLTGLFIAVMLKAIPPATEAFRNAYFPIANDFNITFVVEDDGYNHDIAGTFHKVSYSFLGADYTNFCKFNHISADMKTPTGWVRTGLVEFYDQPASVPETRRPGDQAFGIWKLKTGSYRDAKLVRLNIIHKCLWLYTATTEVNINLDTKEVL